MLIIPDNAILSIRGKTKNGYVVPGDDETIYFNFKDTQTVNDQGIIDPGGNVVGGDKTPGIGLANFVLTTYFLKLFEECLDIPTHMIASDLDNGIMHVKRAKLYGQGHIIPELHLDGDRLGEILYNVKVGGLEVIIRRRFTGSWVRAYEDFYDMMRIDTDNPAMVHFTIKNDEAGDPRIQRSKLITEGILNDGQIFQIVRESQAIERLIQRLAMCRGYEVIDFKIEHGITKYNEHLLVDEFGTGTCRIFTTSRTNNSPKPFDKVEAFLGAEISNAIQNLNTEGLNDQIDMEVERAKVLMLKK